MAAGPRGLPVVGYLPFLGPWSNLQALAWKQALRGAEFALASKTSGPRPRHHIR